MLRPLSLLPRLPRFRGVACAAVALALAACGPGPDRSAPQQPATAPAQQPSQQARAGRMVDPGGPVTVALLAPLTAQSPDAAGAGNAIANAARMAATDLGDPALNLSVHDTRGTPEGARAAAEAALAEGAALILGPLFGANTPPVGEVARRAGLNVISFSNDVSVAGGPVFVSGFTPEGESARIVGFAAARGHDRLAVFYPETGYGRAALQGAERAAGGLGARVVAAGGYPRSFEGIQNSAGSFASTALSAGANAILLPDSGQGLRSAAAFLDYGGVDPARVRYLGLGQWQSPDTRQEATLRGGWFPAPDPDRFQSFAGLYAARNGTRPPFVAVLGYDAVQAAGQMLTAARASGSRTPFGRAEITRAEGFQGALGPFRFEPDGGNRRALAVLEVRSDGFGIVDPAPARLDLLF